MSLYKKHRPRSFKTVIGNEKIITALQGKLADGDFPHAVLFHGFTGCGKTTLARIVAKELGCKGTDLNELNSAHFRGIETIRKINNDSKFLPTESKCRVWIVDECHRLTREAQDAFLKLLEDTPEKSYFILCTTEPTKLIKAIRGRCSEYGVEPLDLDQMIKLIKRVIKREQVPPIDEDIYTLIYENSFGYPRNALQILEQVLAVPEEQRAEVAKVFAETHAEAIELCRLLIKKSPWNNVKEVLKGLKGQEAETIRRIVLGYAQSVLLNTSNDRAALMIEELFEPLYDIGFPGLVYACYSITKN